MQTFNTQTLFTLFVQNLLYNTPLPICETVRKGDMIIEGFEYIYNFHFIRCTTTGQLSDNFDVLERYNFGTEYPNKTVRFIPKTSYYDSETHKYLGKYLRCIRDIFDIDYMPFYNCYNQETLYNTPNIQTKNIFSLPILMNKIYTISFQSTKGCTLKPIFYCDKVIQSDLDTGESLNIHSSIIGSRTYDDLSYFQYQNTNPVKYKYRDYLHLLIGCDDNLQSLIILEGNYHNAPKVFVGHSESITENCHSISRLALIDESNRDTQYAFSNRLVEALLHNIINSQDEISSNVARVQEALQMPVDGIWTGQMKTILFNQYMSQTNPFITKLDITGNVDKDVETYLRRLKK